ncbi:RDD family protein (plasmid) [Burkholderia vietnamiensis]|uniref:RDD domain containing protein n=1 Tax=Burkholderia vietnamiensis (strain G4 / LMG 22486) TaxID=269482 RepID=A4JTY1_BURVG|nr:RDD domain containing protein [Burkholderia vietnamiensis G4]MCB4350107.1 RDD family protein [Burkholderia vietnamiensis]
MIKKDQVLSRLGVIARRLLATAADAFVLSAGAAITTIGAAAVAILVKDQPSLGQLQMLFHNVPLDQLRFAWYQAIARGMAPYAFATLPAAWWLYDALFSWKKLRCTPGKWLFCLKTTSAKERDARLGEVLLRSSMKVMTILSLLFIGSPIVLAAAAVLLLTIPVLTTRGQFLHDFIPGTNVVSKAGWAAWRARKPA